MKDGGPAFPVILNDFRDFDQHPAQGMTLRDWFAGQALMGLVDKTSPQEVIRGYGAVTPRLIAVACGVLADAMLAEREKGETP